tara:strand:- start:645 stop:839 length:195 start_codon:yes stop_codon:yes gene_type:complete
MSKQLDLFDNYEKELQSFKEAALQLVKSAVKVPTTRQQAARPAKIHEKIQSKKELERDERYENE